ncbi:proton myo-inositol cotransporter isoform X2 [Lingula anatina]|uniref:Proton myo-inositol cotransporter isoform X2 n=1 Tax=Lingula anatina TaxID=7574 RepID=A0A1S3IAC6_LINAN|nr:proton myo-inositol cotransporter isoform X2 [Lingula anatina]|eukprot:XP_013395118.1 proton myo-inositol cotransporter isoform X2 [Lingula anatina]
MERPNTLGHDSDDDSALRMDRIRQEQRTPAFVYVLTLFSAIGGFLFGYDTGVVSGAMILLREEFRLDSLWQELIVSVTIGAAAVFALVGGVLNDSFGRKPVIVTASLIFTVGSIIMGLAIDKYMLLAGRIVVGIAIGLASACIPMYVAECAPSPLRGRLVVLYQLLITAGILVAAVCDGLFCYVEQGWRYMLGLAGIPSAIQFLGFLFMPESPRWLITKQRDDQARRVLQSIRGVLDVDDEFDGIKKSCEEDEMELRERGRRPVLLIMLQTPAVRRALIIGCSLQIVQQLVGINTVMYYSATIIKMSGIRDKSTAIWLSAVTAAVNFVFTFVGLYLVEKIGRRPLTLGSLIGAIVSLAWLAIGFQLNALHSPPITVVEAVNPCNQHSTCDQCMVDLSCGFCYNDANNTAVNGSCLATSYDDPLTSLYGRCNSTSLPGSVAWAYDYCPTSFSWMAMVGLVSYLVFFAPGMGPMPWTINSEIYPLWARSTGNAAATFWNWTCNLLVSMTFLTLTESLTRYGTFWLYAGLGTIGFIFLLILLPETKGKSLEEMEGLFARPWCGRGAPVAYYEKSVQYVHIRGLNRDGRDSDLDSPE